MNRRLRHLLVGLSVLGTPLAAQSSAAPASLVPADRQINDAEARLTHARVLSYRRETWRDSLAAYDLLLGASPRNPVLLAEHAELHLRLNNLPAALLGFQAALTTSPSDPVLRLQVAKLLHWTGDKAHALPLLETLARENPSDPEIARLLAEVSGGQSTEPGQNADRALTRLRQRVADAPADATAKANLADFLAARGHAAEARTLYDEARRLQTPAPGDAFDLRHARARIMWGDLYPAEAAFRAALATDPSNPVLNAALINLLISMDRLERAEADARLWLAQGDSAPARQALRNARLKLRWETAEPPAPPAAGTLAATFAAAGPEGVRREEFIRTYVGENTDTPPPAPAYQLSELAGLYASQGDFDRAVRCLRAARRADPYYFPAWLGLAEFLAIARRYDEAHTEFAALATAFPDNRQILLKQARALGWSRRYEDSLVAYDHLRSLNPADPVPLLEQARVAGWAKQRDRSADLYADRWHDPVDARLLAGLRAIPNAPLLFGENPDAHEEPFHYTERFENELPARLYAVPPETAAALEKLRLSLRADFHLQRAFWLENRAKQLAWDRRWSQSEHTYDRLLAATPGNQEALFDLSQVQAAQGLGFRERATFNRLLRLDSNNSLAARGLFRRDRRSAPSLRGEYTYWEEEGRDALSSLRRDRVSLTGQLTGRDQYRLRAGLHRDRESPSTRNDRFHATGFTVEGDAIFNSFLSGAAGFTHREFDDDSIGHADTGRARLGLRLHDAVLLSGGWQRREELYNEFGLFEGTRSDTTWIGIDLIPSRHSDILLRAEKVSYSDSNDGHVLSLRPSWIWTDHPRVFKTTLNLEHRDTDEANTYVFTGPALTDIIHPYWTPQDYSSVSVTFEWYHDLSPEFFIGGLEHYYTLRLTVGTDSEQNEGIGFEAEWHREFADRWLVEAAFQLQRSQLWDGTGLRLALTRRF